MRESACARACEYARERMRLVFSLTHFPHSSSHTQHFSHSSLSHTPPMRPLSYRVRSLIPPWKRGKIFDCAKIYCMPPGIRVHHFTSVLYILLHRHAHFTTQTRTCAKTSGSKSSILGNLTLSFMNRLPAY
jgi:hypothetical protein